MLYDPKIRARMAREKRRLNAMRRIEQIDKVIAELEGTAPGSAGWCRGSLHSLVRLGLLEPGESIDVQMKSCLVGAVQMHVPQPRARFYEMLARHLPSGYGRMACSRLMYFNDAQCEANEVLALLRKARAHQAQLAGLVDG